MTVGFLKRFLTLVNFAAILGIAGTAYGFYAHRQELGEEFKSPGFQTPPSQRRAQKSQAIRIDSTFIPLGQYPEPKTVDNKPVENKPVEKVETAIQKLGNIRDVIICYPPYKGIKPTIHFEYHTKPAGLDSKLVPIVIGEALQTKPHPDPAYQKYGVRVNVAYKFIRCEPDPKDPHVTWFVFDVHCDGKSEQKARWVGDVPVALPKAGAPVKKELVNEIIRPKNWREELDKLKKARAKQPKDPKVKPIDPVKPPPVSKTPDRTDLFQDRNGTLETTEDGINYLRENHTELLKNAYTRPVKEGIQIRALGGRTKGVADQFGLMKDDVIQSVNGTRVRSKTQAVSVVKSLLNKKPPVRYIEVKVLRLGATKVLRVDARDPETRRRARDAFRNR